MNRHPVAGAKFHRPRLHDSGAEAGHFQHFVIRDFLHLAGGLHYPGIGGIHAIHIRKDLADFGIQRTGQSHRRRIGTAPSQRRDVAIGRYALKTGDDDNIAPG